MKKEVWMGVIIAIAVILALIAAFVMIKIYMAPTCFAGENASNAEETNEKCNFAAEDNESPVFRIRFTFRDKYVTII